MSEHALSPAERIVRASALATMIVLAAALVVLGVALHRPSLASAEPAPPVIWTGNLNAESSAGSKP